MVLAIFLHIKVVYTAFKNNGSIGDKDLVRENAQDLQKCYIYLQKVELLQRVFTLTAQQM
jgi:hypothetical protein